VQFVISYSCSLTPWSRVCCENLIAQLVVKFSTLCTIHCPVYENEPEPFFTLVLPSHLLGDSDLFFFMYLWCPTHENVASQNGTYYFLLSETECLLHGTVWVLKYNSSYDWSFPPVLLAVGLNTAVSVRTGGRRLGMFQALVLRISGNTG
jgi:hypothetical protein